GRLAAAGADRDREGGLKVGWLQTGVFLLVAASALGVVRTKDPLAQSVAVSFYGLVLALLFFLHQAPDVALSQIVVGAVALPLMILLALSKIHAQDEERKQAGEEERKSGPTSSRREPPDSRPSWSGAFRGCPHSARTRVRTATCSIRSPSASARRRTW